MFNFIKEINDEINRENRLLDSLSYKEYVETTGTLVIRRAGKRKLVIKQHRYVDFDGRRRSEEQVVGMIDSPEVREEVAKDFCEELRRRVERNLSALSKLQKNFVPFDADTIIGQMSAAKQEILKSDAHRTFLSWGAASRERSASRFGMRADNDGFRITTKEGVAVRSKSEAIISNLLSQHDMAYEYERPLELYDENRFKVIKAPDFTIESKRGLIIWEHLGLLRKDDYFDANTKKLRLYWLNGFIINKNLIVTVDEPDGGIDVKAIDEVIRRQILPHV